MIDAHRIELRSLGFSSSDFPAVKELNALTNDFIFSSALATWALDNHKDYGVSLITLSPFRP